LFVGNNIKCPAVLQIMMMITVIIIIIIIKMQVFLEYLCYAKYYANYFPKVI